MIGERFKELSEAMSALSWAHPFWSTLIYDRLTLKITDAIPTAGVDGKRLYINKEFFIELDPLERIFALAHEVSHAMWMHPEKMAAYQQYGFDGEPFDMFRYNMAADFVNNAMLVHTKVGKIKRSEPPVPGDWLLSKNVHWTDSVDDVYRRLTPPEQSCNQPGGGEDGDGQGGAGGSQSGPDGGQQTQQQGQGEWKLAPHPDRGGETETFNAPRTQDVHIAKGDNDVSEIEWKTSVEAAAIGAKAMGNLHVDMEKYVAEYVEVKRDWKQTLRDYFVRHKGRDRRNWRRANKRKMHSQGIFVPTRHSWKIGRTLIIEDWSGSVSREETAMYRSTLMAILTDCKPKELRVLGVTTEVYDGGLLSTPADLEHWGREATGGTDMEEGFRFVTEEGWIPEVAIVLTDGYTPFTTPPPFPVIWVSTRLDIEDYPYGRAVRME